MPPVAQLISLPSRRLDFLVCIVISFIMFVVHERISVSIDDLFVQLGSYCFTLYVYDVILEQIKMNERIKTVTLNSGEFIHSHASSCREGPFSCDISPLKVKIIPPVGVDNGASWSQERLAECSALRISSYDRTPIGLEVMGLITL